MSGEEQSCQLTEDGGKAFSVNSRHQVRPKSYRRRVKKAKAEEEHQTLANEDENAASTTDANIPKQRRIEVPEHIASSEPVNYNDSNDEMDDFVLESSEQDRLQDEDISLVDMLRAELAKANNMENGESDTESDCNSEAEADETGSLFQPLSPGHMLTLKTSLLMIWMYAIAHCLTASQLGDLLSLINLHLMVSHPVYSSLHRFKRSLNEDLANCGMTKHFFCSLCYKQCDEKDATCSNALCNNKLDNDSREHFIELDIVSQLKNLFKRADFVYGIRHPSRRTKKTNTNIEDIYDGQRYERMFADIDQSSTNLSFVFNTDGVPIFKSSKTSIWPIFLMINELPFKMRTNRDFMLLAGLWCGPTKPVMNLFLSPMMKSLTDLENGIQIENQIVRGFLHCMSCDLPARSAVLNINNHNGEYACMKCYQSGMNHRTVKGGNIRVFPYDQSCPDGPPRFHEDVLVDAQAAISDACRSKPVHGIKGPSVLMMCPNFDCVKGLAIDYMHMLCLGLIRMLLNLWFNVSNSSQQFSMYTHIKVVDDRLSKLKVPCFITRTPRSIAEHLKFWKASELRSWFFFYSVPCLNGLMQVPYLYHYYALVQAVFLLNQTSISIDDLSNAQRLLGYFVFMLPTLYGERFVTLNAHSLLHLPEMVKELGPLWCYSCFAFEGANGELLKMFHGTQFIDLQIANAVHIFQLLPTLANDINSSDVAYKFVKSLSRMHCYIESQSEMKSMPMGKPYKKELDLVIDVQVREFIGCTFVPLNLDFYKRFKINGQMFHSKDYTRVHKRNSYSVKFRSKDEVCYGFILWFGVYVHNGESKSCVCIEKLEREEFTFSHTSNDNQDELVLENFMKLDLSQFQYLKTSGTTCIASVCDIIQMCVCLNIDDKICFSLEPNACEKNL